MSFHLYESNDFSALARKLADILFADRPGTTDPFAEETVVVPNQGLARWLKLTLANLNGLCPPLDLPYPGAFLYRYVFDPMMGRTAAVCDDETDLPFSPDTVEWRILSLLATLENAPGFERVRAFTGNDTFRRYQLAGRLARLFDRYMTYRPDLLDGWERGHNPVAGEDAAWQARLWRELIADNTASGGACHFSGLYQRFIDRTQAIRSTPAAFAFLAPLLAKRRACYFGVSSLPPAHLDILVRLARFPDFDLHFFAINPCREEWGDARSLKVQLREQATLVKAVGPQLAPNYQIDSHPLLGSLGRTGRDFFSLLLAYDDIIDERLFTPPDPSDTSALATLQRGLLDNAAPVQKQAHNPADRSIAVHACHSPMREVEALHDQLLALFRDRPDLAPRDISVYTPDVETYAPYIDAVFGRTRPGAPGHIPYAVADKSLLRTVDACQAFLSLLATATSRFKASDVLALLQHTLIRERFGFSEQDLAALGSLLKAANLAWGLDAEFRERQGGAPTYASTWRFALDRLLLGAAMQDATGDAAPLALAEDLCIPSPEADGNASIIGRLAAFVDALADLHEQCAGELERTCAAWLDRLNTAVARFFATDERAPYGVLLLRQSLDHFARYTAQVGSAAIPFAVVRAWLNAQLAGTPGSEHVVTGRTTFSRFQPMRNVPARVICLLGMNDNAFPRDTPHLSFDLMERRTGSRVGDRQTRDEDRYAFLEALIAARESLIITYTGQSAKDNKPLPPSVLVSELLDAVDAAFAFPEHNGKLSTAAAVLTVRHPLHPFSSEYFKPDRDPRLRSFSQTHYAVAQKISTASDIPTPPTSTLSPSRAALSSPIVLLDDLVAFFRAPCKYFYTKRLGVFLNLRDDELPDDEERLDPSALDAYTLKLSLLKALETCEAPDTADRLRLRWEIEGRLPPGAGNVVTAAEDKVRDLLTKKEALLLGAPCDKFPLDLALNNDMRLQGTLDTLHQGNTLLFMRPAREQAKDTVTAWIHHLAACAHGLTATTWGVYEGTKTTYPCYGPVDPATARRILTALADLFADGSRRPLCFDPALGRKLIDGKAFSEADWCGDGFNRGVDVYLQRAFGDTLPDPDSSAWQTFTDIAHTLFDDLPKAPVKRKKGDK